MTRLHSIITAASIYPAASDKAVPQFQVVQLSMYMKCCTTFQDRSTTRHWITVISFTGFIANWKDKIQGLLKDLKLQYQVPKKVLIKRRIILALHQNLEWNITYSAILH